MYTRNILMPILTEYADHEYISRTDSLETYILYID